MLSGLLENGFLCSMVRKNISNLVQLIFQRLVGHTNFTFIKETIVLYLTCIFYRKSTTKPYLE